ncbi:hypothetical protein PG984_016428 [Apiospora sp. TS-2023a]
MEAFAAFGFATNIVSFVDFVWKLLATANETYSSGSGVVGDAQFLDKITSNVQQHAERVAAAQSSTPQLRDLARECDEVAQDLLKILGKMRVKGGNTHWKTFLAALKGVCSQKQIVQLTDKIYKIQTRISSLTQELLLFKVILLTPSATLHSNNQSGLGRDIQDLQQQCRTLGIATKDKLETVQQDVQRILKKLHDDNIATMIKEHLQQCESQEISSLPSTEMLDQMQSLVHTMENLKVRAMDTYSTQKLLKRLHFTSISTRERKIEKAHKGTFKWLANPSAQANQLKSCPHFFHWLRDGDGIFWLHGKPGSGKSTFMKFAFAQESVAESLQHWADGCKLFKASFYFWCAGYPLQKSLEGLLRTLLFKILQQMPDAIPSIVSDPELTVPLSYNEDWDLDTLFRMYEIIVHQKKDVKFCFFIDGLDELNDDEHRSVRDLISTLDRLEMSDKIKLCVASRPWQEFKDVYGQTPSQRLKLEDLTRDDIHAYVSDCFKSHTRFLELRNRDSNYENLVEEVVNRAEGVFLWVRLVVGQLLDGFTSGKSVQTLQQQVMKYPEDLDKFFSDIINSIPAADRNRAAQLLRVAAEADQPRLLIFYQFLNNIILDEADELDASYTPLNKDDAQTRCDNMRRQLNASSRGLLEVTTDNDMITHVAGSERESPYFRLKVDFLHRTVRDFLVKSLKTLEFFSIDMDSSVSLSIASAKAAIAQLKFAEFPLGTGNAVTQLSKELFFYTRHAAKHTTNHPEAINILDGLLATAETVYQQIRQLV